MLTLTFAEYSLDEIGDGRVGNFTTLKSFILQDSPFLVRSLARHQRLTDTFHPADAERASGHPQEIIRLFHVG